MVRTTNPTGQQLETTSTKTFTEVCGYEIVEWIGLAGPQRSASPSPSGTPSTIPGCLNALGSSWEFSFAREFPAVTAAPVG